MAYNYYNNNNYVLDEIDTRNEEELETLVWTPGHHLTDRQIDQFLVISRYFVIHNILCRPSL